MACTQEFIDFVVDQLSDFEIVRPRKMFGDWIIYVNEKPLILACDNIAYVRKHPAIDAMMTNAECGFPYEGSKEQYILDVEHRRELVQVLRTLEPVVPYSKKKKKKE